MPRTLMQRYKEEIVSEIKTEHDADVKGEFSPDIHQAFVQKLVRTQIDEIFEKLPELDGLVVRVGETYLHDMPHHTGGDPIVNGVESHLVMLNLLRECVCVKHGKRLLYRTWLSEIDEDAEQYRDVSARVEPHPLLMLSIKHCVGDFHRAHTFSPPLGIGQHPQIVEVQCQREYEGKGAYPNYIADGVINGFEEYDYLMPKGNTLNNRCLRDLLQSPQFAGVWTWSRGGGWKGPYIQNEFWCDANAWVIAQWGRNPESDCDDLLRQFFAEHGFNQSDQNALLELSHLSTKAVLRGVASIKGGHNTLWTRDHYIGGIEDEGGYMDRAITEIVQNDRVEEMIAERESSVILWKQIVKLADSLTSGSEELREFIRVSCRYGLCCYQVYLEAWTAMLIEKQAVLTDQPVPWDRIHTSIVKYDKAWQRWHLLHKNHPLCSSLYQDTYCEYVRDQGMIPSTGVGDSMSRYREAIASETVTSF
ncbi:hypothetical protein HW115_13150 [Verrucomicrobiaceae bacterium N1E253]|uniref:Uncharacterized protein n=1 Tax=Oceaniferula marina TaxID=2748318 RepID=A0A851GI30_9BACT|nr:hypothetical protein [Oceaniferula marina]NWK56562.1 hypothetical protein [Oceaniferula marina]